MLQIVLRTAQRIWHLTNREAEVLGWILNGIISSKDLAAHMKISESTVGKHLESIARKTSLSGRVHLVAVLFRALCNALDSISNPDLRETYPRVSVLDDDEVISETVVEMLQVHGFAASMVPNAASVTPQGIMELGSEVLLCDYVLPKTDGLEVARSLSEHEEESPSVVLFTGYPERLSDKSDDSIVSVLHKPLHRNVLAREIWIGWMDFRIRHSLRQSIVDEHTVA